MHEKIDHSPNLEKAEGQEAAELAVEALRSFAKRGLAGDKKITAHYTPPEIKQKTRKEDSEIGRQWRDRTYERQDDYEDEEYDEDVERSEYSDKNRSFEIFPLPGEIIAQYPFLNELPHNVGVMGGMARSIAREIIAGDKEPIRDIDLVYIENDEDEPDWQVLEDLSQKYMPDDHAYGHGMQTERLGDYFSSRDLTVNECLILNRALVVSNFAYNDLQENIIRPTYYEKKYKTWNSRGRNAMRALAMQAALMESTESYPTLEDFNINPYYVPSFEVAVQLNKTMSRGAEVAYNFTNSLADYNIIPAELAGKPKAVARYLLEYKVENFEFRATDDERLRTEVDGENDKFRQPGDISAEYHISDSLIRNVVGEYDDDPTTERYSGHYTQEEFDEINRNHFCYEYEDEDDWYYEDDDYYDEDEDEE